MKQIYLGFFLLAAFSLNVCGQRVTNKFGEKIPRGEVKMINEKYPAVRAGQTPEEILACPDGTVLGGELTVDAGYTGFQSSDQGRPDSPSKFYQSFSGCYQSVNAVRFIGLFNYYDEVEGWLPCNSRGGMNEEGELTKSIRFEVSFYRMNADGKPGELVYSEEMDLLGDLFNILYDGNTNMYEFTANLKKEIKLESGFFSVSAVDMKDAPSCWFSLFCADSAPGYALVSLGEYGMIGAPFPMCFCLKGNGEFSAKKALKLSRLLTPEKYNGEKYAKVQVEIQNMGSESLDNVRLELWAEGELLATEDVDATIKSLDSYKYTFRQRIDCSASGVHHFEVKNVTPGDEKLCDEILAFSVTALEEGKVCESKSTYSFEDCCIKSVSIGDISNQSAESEYSDFTDKKTTILPGQALELTVETEGARFIGVWVDWNNNGTFDDEGELISFITEESTQIRIPDNIAVKEGEKRMRIVMSADDMPGACGDVYMGETEDYTLVVARPQDSPVVQVDKSEIEESLENDSKNVGIEVANKGTKELNVSLSVMYALPYAPTYRSMTPIKKSVADVVKSRELLRIACKDTKTTPKSSEDIQYTLKYDDGQKDGIGLSNGDYAIFAHYYPGEMLANLSGMQVSSIDVYLLSAAQKSSIIIYGENSQTASGKELVNQTFVPVENAWNHIVLKEPLTITNEDLWIGIKLEGMAKDSYCIGVDAQRALRGFGDLANIGGETWWSMADLGVDNNFCIRANVTGERTPAINWLTLGKKELTVGVQGKETVNAELNATSLSKGLYEATIEIKSNDALEQVVKIPVYLINGKLSGLEKVEALKSSIRFEAGSLIVESKELINRVTLTDMAGAIRKDISNSGQTIAFSLADLSTGVYILNIRYANGNKEVVKFPVLK